MPLSKDQKVEWAKKFKDDVSKASVTIFADYKGLTAVQADDFRKQIRDVGGSVKVVKNNIAFQAAKDGDMGEGAKKVTEGLVGPTLVAYAFGDPAATAKVVNKFAKENEAMQIKDSLMDGAAVSPDGIKQLADLPSREVLLGMLLSTMNGPARGFVSVLAAVPRGLVTVLDAYKTKKESEGA